MGMWGGEAMGDKAAFARMMLQTRAEGEMKYADGMVDALGGRHNAVVDADDASMRGSGARGWRVRARGRARAGGSDGTGGTGRHGAGYKGRGRGGRGRGGRVGRGGRPGRGGRGGRGGAGGGSGSAGGRGASSWI